MSEQTPITVEENKATVEVMAFRVTEFAVKDERAAFRCPKCHRQIAIALGKPYRHTCGATIIAQN